MLISAIGLYSSSRDALNKAVLSSPKYMKEEQNKIKCKFK